MSGRRSAQRTGRSSSGPMWPLLLLLLAVVLVPTLCMLWFMNQVAQSERLAVRRKLTDVLRSQLPLVRDRLETSLRARAAAVEDFDEELPGAMLFHECVTQGLADSLICFDAQGRQTYPSVTSLPTGVSGGGSGSGASGDSGGQPGPWEDASRLEHVQKAYLNAATAYSAIADQALARQPPNVPLAAHAYQAAARCYVPAGRSELAIQVLTETLGHERFAEATDVRGRLIVADVELRGLELMADASAAEFRLTEGRLRRRLMDYGDPLLATAQRQFLMKRLQALVPDREPFPTLSAEILAAAYLEARPSPTQDTLLRAAGVPDVWQMGSPRGRAILLFTTAHLCSQMRDWIASPALPPEVTVDVLPPKAAFATEHVIGSLTAGEPLPGWQLVLKVNDQAFFQSAGRRRVPVHLWTAILVIATTSALAVAIAGAIRRQSQLARLKNDLVATISHELKTPLASMRLLVDTLLDKHDLDSTQTREYLQLIGKENLRLSRLIDNFLAFSRIERNRYAFDMARTSVAEIVQDAVESVHERFQAADCQLQVTVARDLPAVIGDHDALVTVLLNLLDNAYKYTGDDKQIALSVGAQQGTVRIEVRDNGVGLSLRDRKRVFQRFYQVDQGLSRSSGGCGLGLSIVKYIVDAHEGEVGVLSHPGKGTRFLIRLPAAKTELPPAPAGVA